MSERKSGIKVTASDALEFEPVAPKLKKAGSVLKSVLFVALAVGGGAAGWAFYGDQIMSLMSDSESNVPIVRAELGPVKVRPANPGGLQVPDRDKLVYNRIQNPASPNGTSPSVERLLPPPETPLPKPTSLNKIVQPATPTTAIKLPVPPLKPKRINETPRVADVKRAEKPVPPPPAPDAKLTPAPAQVAKVAPSLPTKKALVKKATPAPKVAAITSSAPPPDGKAFKVQLAAARTPTAARAEWDRLRSKHLDLLGDMGLSVTKVNLGGTKGVFYRLRVGPLKGEVEARALCKTLAKRKVSCLIVRPGK